MHSIIPQNTYNEKNVYRLIHLTDKKDKEQTSNSKPMVKNTLCSFCSKESLLSYRVKMPED